MGSPIISIAIATRDRESLLRQTLELLFENTSVGYELFVVDNGSTDGTAEYLAGAAEAHPEVTVVRNERNLGVARAVNQGWYRATHKDYLVRLDDDVLLPEGWAEDLIEICDKVPQVGLAGVSFDQEIPNVSEVNGVRLHRAHSLGGACVMMPGRAHKKLGYWNEHYPRIGHEDWDMSMRVNFAGMWNACHPDLNERAVHLSGERGDDEDRREHTAVKLLAQQTNFGHALRFHGFYEEMNRVFGRPVPVYMGHTEPAVPGGGAQ